VRYDRREISYKQYKEGRLTGMGHLAQELPSKHVTEGKTEGKIEVIR